MKAKNTLPSSETIAANLELRDGHFYRRPSGRGRCSKGGMIAGILDNCGYRIIKIGGKSFIASRLVWKLITGRDPVAEIDHIDRNKDNNRFENLREATRSQNMQNALYKKSGEHGKSVQEYRPGKWRARISVNKERIYLGVFDTPGEAAAAHEAAAAKYHGEFARIDEKGTPPAFIEGWEPKKFLYKGVKQIPSGRWIARLGFGGDSHYLGVFDTEDQAKTAYRELKDRLAAGITA